MYDLNEYESKTFLLFSMAQTLKKYVDLANERQLSSLCDQYKKLYYQTLSLTSEAASILWPPENVSTLDDL